MSSIMDRLEEDGLEALRDHGSDWLGKAIDGGRAMLAKTLQPQDPISVSGNLGLNKVAEHKDELARLGYQRATAFLGRVAMGQDERAARLLAAYGGGQGAWGEADAAVASAGDEVERAKRDYDAAVAIAKDIGSAAAKAALPILLAFAGI